MSITDQQDNSSSTVVYDVYSAYQYPWMCLNFFFGYWLVSSICRRVIQSLKILEIGSKFNELEEEKKRNIITYVMELFVTTIAFFLQVIGGVDILFRNEDTTSPEKIDLMVLAMLFIIVLYIWELCYRQTIGWPLLVHHLVSIFCIQTLTATFIQTQEVIYLRLLILAGFYATTEQISFVALFCFRLSILPKLQSIMFYLAALQTFVFKTVITIATAVLYIIAFYVDQITKSPEHRWGNFWRFAFLPLLFLLFVAQVYAGWILFNLSKRCKIQQKKQALEESGALSETQKVKRESILERQDMELSLDAFENNSAQLSHDLKKKDEDVQNTTGRTSSNSDDSDGIINVRMDAPHKDATILWANADV